MEEEKLKLRYQLSRKFDELGDDARSELLQALSRAEKRITLSTILGHWKEILILALVVSFLVVYQHTVNLQKDIVEQKAQLSVQTNLKNLDSSLEKVNESIGKIYPAMEKQANALSTQRKELQRLSDNVKLIPKEEFKQKSDKLEVSELSNEMLKLGYPNSVIKDDR